MVKPGIKPRMVTPEQTLKNHASLIALLLQTVYTTKAVLPMKVAHLFPMMENPAISMVNVCNSSKNSFLKNKSLLLNVLHMYYKTSFFFFFTSSIQE